MWTRFGVWASHGCCSVCPGFRESAEQPSVEVSAGTLRPLAKLSEAIPT